MVATHVLRYIKFYALSFPHIQKFLYISWSSECTIRVNLKQHNTTITCIVHQSTYILLEEQSVLLLFLLLKVSFCNWLWSITVKYIVCLIITEIRQ